MIAVVVVTAVLVLALRWPGLLIVGAIFTYQASVLSGFDGLTTVYTLAALCVALWASRSKLGSARLNFVDIAFSGYISFCAFSVMYSQWPDRAWSSFLTLSFAASSMYLIGRLCALIEPPESLATQLLVGLVLFGAVFSLLLVAQSDGSVSRLRIGDSTAVGLAQPLPLALLAVAIGIVAAAGAGRWLQLLFMAGAVGAVAYASILSGTRGVFVAFLVSGVVVLALSVSRKQLWVALGVIGLAAVIALPFLLSGTDLPIQAGLDRLLTNFNDNSIGLDTSSQLRLEQQLRGIDIWQQYPILGAGVGGYDAISGLSYPHNVLIEVVANTGALGLFLFVTLVVLVGYNLFSEVSFWAKVIFFGLLVASFTHMQLSFSLDMAKPFFLLSGIAAGVAGHKFAVRRKKGRPHGFSAKDSGAQETGLYGL